MSLLKRNQLTAFILLPLTFLLTWTEVPVYAGWSSINQRCTPFQDQYNSCDPYAFLYCDTSDRDTYLCKCTSPEFVWQTLVGRCTLRIGSNCHRGPMGTTGNNQIPDCPPSAHCDTRSNTCKCNSYHIPSHDGSACNKGITLDTKSFHFSVLFGIIVWILGISVSS